MAETTLTLTTPQSLPKLLLGISTKMYFTHHQTTTYLHSLLSTIKPSEKLQLFYIPSFPSLYSCASIIQSQSPFSVLLGAQDCSEHPSGAHTGSVSAPQLREVGCTLVELGHAERRRDPLSESNPLIAAKAKAAVEAGLIPLICIGERKRVGGGVLSQAVGMAVEEVMGQVRPVLEGLKGTGVRFVVFAYEPVWAIGAERPAEAEYVLAVVKAVRGLVDGLLTGLQGVDVRFLYGGSAGPGVWRDLRGGLDGLFLGRFAHDVGNVGRVVEEMLME